MIERIKNNKILRIITMIVKAIISLFIVIVISIIFIQRISNNKLTLGGFGLYTIVTGSMEPKYNISDMVISKKVNASEIKEGDDVVYLGNKDDFKDKIVTHRVIKKTGENGKIIFQTKGIANDIEDPLVEGSQILGKVVYKSIILSFISKIVNNTYGFYFVVFVPFAILSVMEVIDIVEEKKEEKE